MNKTSRISDAEWQVMNVLWEKAPITAMEVVEILRSSTGWKPTTVYTLISRLVSKKAIAIDKSSSPFVCRPMLTREEYRREERRSFLEKVYDGSLNLLLMNILAEDELSETEIDELKRILEKGGNKEG
ncbi:Penicillinase repressor [Acididesulfobacillus acetoxydans]|uniref:Penicillinase repressor n=1 Tax=Acididesulfobacillus acetoxydans TaxID=1561005 RepID=A0A8S0WH08_9FIRM|nr:BlaI/MecI/CopY family transcriptional regulator [Acididesulfobacillus acetoxydans]CAA7602352.1 Penicillinase repressor [Acididesulfobacillus acetoxydans]CEJ08413.1 Penicillinase repressor [Acididesulfobacillus acetoxydans]